MASQNLYQNIRTQVKKNLNHVVKRVNMEPAIRASTPVPIDEAEAALREFMSEHGFHVIHETDVKAIHNHYTLKYPEFRILKFVRAQNFMSCPMASTAVEINPGTGAVLPPGVILYEIDGETRVSAIRPSTLLALFTEPELRTTIRELEGYLWTALEEGIPESTMLSTEPPVAPGENDRRALLKQSLNLVLSLVDAEYSMHVSSPEPVAQVKEELTKALDIRGQKVLGKVANGQIMLVVNPGQAHKLLAIDPDVAVFAPLSVAVFEENGRTHVRTVRPSTLLIFYTQPDMQNILMEMEMLLWNSLTKGVPEARVESRQPPLPPETGQATTAGGLPGGLDSLRKYRPE
jgi:uncharacterized protein (DUF302 family)